MAESEPTREQIFVRNAVEQMLYTRSMLSHKIDGPGRNLNSDCGYPEVVQTEDYQAMYSREGIATRIIGLYPQECWQLDPEIYDDENEGVETAFEKAWKLFAEDHNILSYWERLDEQSGIGRFGGLLLGVNDGMSLDQPLKGYDADGKEVGAKKSGTVIPVDYSYTRVLSEPFIRVGEFEQNTKSPRFGQPKTYNIQISSTLEGSRSVAEPQFLTGVHHTRIIHLADNLQCSEVYGTPRMQSLYNRMCDIRKLLGGSAEMFWKGAFPGVSFEMDPRITAADASLDPVAIRAEWQAYTLGLQRFLATEGLHANQLSVQVADPASHLLVQLQAIAVAMGCPLRVLVGSESAQLASSQDTKRWNGRLDRRCNRHLTPREIRPTVQRLIGCGVLPRPANDRIITKWPDRNSLSASDKADVALKISQAMSAYAASGAEAICPPLEWWTIVAGFPQEVAQQIIDATDMAEELVTDTADPVVDPSADPSQQPQGKPDPIEGD
jgi:hypothetical protein